MLSITGPALYSVLASGAYGEDVWPHHSWLMGGRFLGYQAGCSEPAGAVRRLEPPERNCVVLPQGLSGLQRCTVGVCESSEVVAQLCI